MELLFVSFIAGVLTVLAPCILPVLPIVIGGSAHGERDRIKPFVITGALVVSIVVFTLLLKFSTALIDIPPRVWAIISGSIIIVFGLTSIFPSAWDWLSVRLGLGRKSEHLLAESAQKPSRWGDALVGLSLGPVFSSCSPTYFLILAVVLPQSFARGVVDLIAYAAGLGLIVLLIAFLGQAFVQKIKWAANPNGWFKKGLGILFIIVGIAIASGLEKDFEVYLLDKGLFRVTQFETTLLERIGNSYE